MSSKETRAEVKGRMTVVVGTIGSIAGATLTTADLARARVFYLARLGFPVLYEEGDAFTFSIGGGAITVRRALADPARPRQSSLERIALWCASLDDLRAVAEALTAAGIEHSRSPITRFGTDGVVFRDPDGIEWELRVR